MKIFYLYLYYYPNTPIAICQEQNTLCYHFVIFEHLFEAGAPYSPKGIQAIGSSEPIPKRESLPCPSSSHSIQLPLLYAQVGMMGK
jgi:hypothetical protein